MSVRVEELLARAALPKGQHVNHTPRCTAQESHTPRASTGITHSRKQHKGQRRNHTHPRGQHRNHTPQGAAQESHNPRDSIRDSTGITNPWGQHRNHTPQGAAQKSHTPGDSTGITHPWGQHRNHTTNTAAGGHHTRHHRAPHNVNRTAQLIDISNVRTCANSQIVMLFDRGINKRFVPLWSIWDTP